MRVIYIGIIQNRCMLISYKGDKLRKKGKYKPNYHIATDTGLHLSKEYKNDNYMEIDEITIKSYDFNIKQFILDINSLVDDNIRIINFGEQRIKQFINYLRFGNMENGLKDKDFKDSKDIVIKLKNNLAKKTVYLEYQSLNEEHFIELITPLLLNNDIDITETGKDFFNPKVWKHDLLDGKYIVIDREIYRKYDDYYTFIVVNYPTSKEIGRPLSGITESLLKLKDIPEFYKKIIDTMFKLMKSDKRIFVLPIDNLTNKLNIKFSMISNYKLIPIIKEHQYVLLNGANTTVAYTVFPPALSRTVKDNINEHLKTDYKEIDITNKLYKDKRLISIPQSGYTFKVKIDNKKITIILGLTMPTRNSLKRIEKRVKQIILRYKYVDEIIKYDVVIKLDNDEELITYSPFNGFSI